jgi:pectate lyase
VSIQKNAHHIWIDHCDISEGTDGNLDITNGANYVTVSWTKFHYSPRTDDVGNDSTGPAGHRYANLVGSTDTPVTYDDANALNVTWHHNWWSDNVAQRQPRVRFGKNHLFNNLWSSAVGSYCIRAGTSAQILVQNSVFSSIVNPQEFYEDSEQTASITSADNVYDNTTGTTATGGAGPAFTAPPYAYTLDATSTLQDAIQRLSGPR